MPEIPKAPLAPDHSPSSRPRSKLRRVALGILFGVVAVFLGLVSLCVNWPCLPLWIADGVLIRDCPVGEPVPVASINASGLRRGHPGRVEVGAEAVYSLRAPDTASRTAIRRFNVDLLLVDSEGKERALKPEKRFKKLRRGWKYANVALPDVPDGDYILRARVDTGLGEVLVDAPLAIYAPAIAHVVTDRPIYKPGQTLRFRAVLLTMADYRPIEGRPGVFTVLSPAGDKLLEEKVPAGTWGVAASDLPLADDAEPGLYKVAYTSGGARDELSVRVEPFTLPRFEVTARATQPWYKVGEKPEIKGSVRYRSGAPVADAALEIQIGANSPSTSGGAVFPDPVPWPAPTEWLEKHQARTDKGGSFTLSLSAVPQDLRGLARLPVQVVATDATGERISGSAELLLSEHRILASVETELADGLVPDFNNRVYVRVSTPDGLPLPGADVTVMRAWDAQDPGVTAQADASSVAALQIDPGKPVSVVIPAVPVRRKPLAQEQRVSLQSIEDFLSSEPVTLDEHVVLDTWPRKLESCAVYVTTKVETTSFLIEVSASGALSRVLSKDDPLSRCVAARLKSLPGPKGQPRLYNATFGVLPLNGAVLQADISTWPYGIDSLADQITEAALKARPCIIHNTATGKLPDQLVWSVARGSTSVQTRWADLRDASWYPSTERSCVKASFSGFKLDEPAGNDSMGVAQFGIQPGATSSDGSSSPTVKSAWELRILARNDKENLGETRVILNPGAVPTLRLRPEQPIVRAGEPIVIKPLRGPDFSGELPDKEQKIKLLQGGEELGELVYDPKARLIQGKVPEKAKGLLTVDWLGARAILLVPRDNPLSVELKTEKEIYRPGERATLQIQTRQGERAVEAGVSLSGVDEALGQIATLTGPDDFGRVTVRASLLRSAFGIFDARALLQGRIQGNNALLATLQRVSDIPKAASLEEGTNTSGSKAFDPSVLLTEVFYDILGDSRMAVAAWEESAPESEVLSSKRMVEIWEKVIKDRKKADKSVVDAYGETLFLTRLPADLLALCDPRVMISSARRLPEDVENWAEYVAREAK